MEARSTRGANAVESRVAPGTELLSSVKILAQDLPHLVREEIALFMVETRVAATRAGILAALGFGILLGSFFVAAGLSIALSQALGSLWAGPLIVGGLLVAAGLGGAAVLLKKAKPAETPAPLTVKGIAPTR